MLMEKAVLAESPGIEFQIYYGGEMSIKEIKKIQSNAAVIRQAISMLSAGVSPLQDAIDTVQITFRNYKATEFGEKALGRSGR